MSNYTYIKMPAVFRREDEGTLFKRCDICDTNLLHKGQVYVIEKGFRHGELQFQYATCMDCVQKMDEDMSYPSLRMRDFWERKYLRTDERFEKLSKTSLRDVKPWIATCAVTGQHRRELDEYQLVAVCQGNQLFMCGYPLMLSEQALEQLRDLMSKETREEWDRFARDVLDLSPETVHGLDSDE